jgi:hypothetical protein
LGVPSLKQTLLIRDNTGSGPALLFPPIAQSPPLLLVVRHHFVASTHEHKQAAGLGIPASTSPETTMFTFLIAVAIVYLGSKLDWETDRSDMSMSRL